MIQDINPKKCFTIGYGDYPIDLFVYFLNKVGIDTIVDVRSSPYSRFNPYFNRDNLENFLKKSNIGYRYMGDQIGGRYSNPNLLFPDGTVNYKKVQSTEIFLGGINQLLSLISSGKKIALMCAEKEPEKCHRFALISRVLQSKGINVIHVRSEITLQTNEDLEKELINTVIDKNQINISNEPVNLVDFMYEKLNKKIAYKLKETNADFYEYGFNEKQKIAIFNKESGKNENEDQNKSLVSEPNFDNNVKIEILSRSDSFTDKHVKKQGQQKLLL